MVKRLFRVHPRLALAKHLVQTKAVWLELHLRGKSKQQVKSYSFLQVFDEYLKCPLVVYGSPDGCLTVNCFVQDRSKRKKLKAANWGVIFPFR